jgi:hypothetical protein
VLIASATTAVSSSVPAAATTGTCRRSQRRSLPVHGSRYAFRLNGKRRDGLGQITKVVGEVAEADEGHRVGEGIGVELRFAVLGEHGPGDAPSGTDWTYHLEYHLQVWFPSIRLPYSRRSHEHGLHRGSAILIRTGAFCNTSQTPVRMRRITRWSMPSLQSQMAIVPSVFQPGQPYA